MTQTTEHTLRLIDEFLTQGGHAHGIDADTLHREAALIAAAPDLLAALLEMLPYALQSWIESGDPKTGEQYECARAAIIKATGEETQA